MGCGQSSESTAIEPLGTDYKISPLGNPNIINQSTSFGTSSFAKTNNGYHNHHNPLQTIDEKERQAFEAIMDEFEEDFLKQEKEENDYNNSIMNKNDKPKIENADQNKTERAALHPNSRADSWTTLSSTKADSTSRTTSESSTRPHTALDVNDEEEGGGGGHSKDGSPIKKSDRLITNLDPPAVVEEPATPETNAVEEEPENEPNGDAPSAPEEPDEEAPNEDPPDQESPKEEEEPKGEDEAAGEEATDEPAAADESQPEETPPEEAAE